MCFYVIIGLILDTQSNKKRMVMMEMIKRDYYVTNKQGNCVNYGFHCFSCSHWHGYFNNGSCDMFKITSTTTSSGDVE